MRDALLAVTGELDTRLHGLPSEDFNSTRRSLYLLVNRQQMPGVLATFDVSVPNATLPIRNKTTVPQQALYLMNNRFIADRAARLIEQLDEQLPAGQTFSEEESNKRIEKLYEWVYGRRPIAQERSLAQDFLSSPPLDVPPNNKLDEKQKAWQYGYGVFQPEQERVQFTPFDHFDGHRWRNRLPPSEGEFAYLDTRGGRPGPNPATAVIRRFTAPISGLFLFKGVFQAQPLGGMGDGVEIRVVSSRQGPLGRYETGEEKEKIRIEKIEVQAGDTIDFIVSCRKDNRFDEYNWPIEVWEVEPIKSGGLNGLDAWPTEPLFNSSVAHWIGPQSPWEQYAHALLISNEFMFVD